MILFVFLVGEGFAGVQRSRVGVGEQIEYLVGEGHSGCCQGAFFGVGVVVYGLLCVFFLEGPMLLLCC